MTSERSILRSPWNMLRFVSSTPYLPLTLTLGQREQQASDWCLTAGRWANSGAGVIKRRWTFLPLPRGEGRGEGEASVAQRTVQSVASGVRSRSRHLALAGSGRDSGRAAVGASHTCVSSVMVGMARCAVPARVVAGGTNDPAALAFEGGALLHAARTSQRDVPTALNTYYAVGYRLSPHRG